MRYQATHDRAYHKLSDELRKLKNDRRKAEKGEAAHLSEANIQAIGFESQKAQHAARSRRAVTEERRNNEEIRRATTEVRKSELHSKRPAPLDAQIARLAVSAPAPSSISRCLTLLKPPPK